MSKKTCLVCQSTTTKPPVNEWIKENQFHNTHGQILKEVYVGKVKQNPDNRKIINTVYYCSWACFNEQLNHEEEQDFKKGFCQTCRDYLVALNEQCSDEKHQKEAHYYRLKGDKS